MRQTMAQARHDVIRELVTAYEEAGEPIPSVGEMRILLVPRDYNENHITIWRDYHTLGIHGSNQGGDSGSGARRVQKLERPLLMKHAAASDDPRGPLQGYRRTGQRAHTALSRPIQIPWSPGIALDVMFRDLVVLKNLLQGWTRVWCVLGLGAHRVTV